MPMANSPNTMARKPRNPANRNKTTTPRRFHFDPVFAGTAPTLKSRTHSWARTAQSQEISTSCILRLAAPTGLYLDDPLEGFGLSAEDPAVLYSLMADNVGEERLEFLG